MSANLETVKAMYASFDAGDIGGVLSHLATDVVWVLKGDSDALPIAGEFNGHAGVGGFFSSLAEHFGDMKLIREIWVDGGERVVASGSFKATVRANGASIDCPWVHIWTFNAAGQASQFLDFVDTLAFARALQPQQASLAV
jgi:ketosteroid isomerase-like protein